MCSIHSTSRSCLWPRARLCLPSAASRSPGDCALHPSLPPAGRLSSTLEGEEWQGGCQPVSVSSLGQDGQERQYVKAGAWAGPLGHHDLAVETRPACGNNQSRVSSPTWPALLAPAVPAALSLAQPLRSLSPAWFNPGWVLLSGGPWESRGSNWPGFES